jgi:pSer/pThr/pTyr-binding forkhead associated (FHA) protein
MTELKTGELVVGSGKEAALRLQQLDLAPRHLTVVVGEDGTTLVRPFGAQFLVTVNGRPISQPTRLTSGDLIGAGGARFRFLSSADAAERVEFNESAWLVNDSENIAYTLARKALTIGRDAASTIQLRDPDSSRQHADISAEAGLHLIHSLGTAGTKVNGERVNSSRILQEGDRIEIGELTLRYTRNSPPEGMRVSSGGDEYDLERSGTPTGSQGKLRVAPAKALNSPKVLRIVAIIVAIMAVAVAVLVIAA